MKQNFHFRFINLILIISWYLGDFLCLLYVNFVLKMCLISGKSNGVMKFSKFESNANTLHIVKLYCHYY